MLQVPNIIQGRKEEPGAGQRGHKDLHRGEGQEYRRLRPQMPAIVLGGRITGGFNFLLHNFIIFQFPLNECVLFSYAEKYVFCFKNGIRGCPSLS